MSSKVLDGSGRFVLLDKPAASPFSDVVTGTPEGPVFDLSVDLDYYCGVVYLKAEHVIEMAHILGMSTKEEAEELRARISQLESENDEIPENVKRLINGINSSLDNYRGIQPSAILLDDAHLPEFVKSAGNGKGNVTGKSEVDSSDKSGDVKPDSGKVSSSPIEDSKPSVSKRSPKLSASSNDGFGFDA